ncbi:GrpE nucleotide exchange factor [Russula brevipes]|nr:GrpE nucleotide exchange factor [Russula brevipes]
MSRNALNLLRSATSSLSPLAISRTYYPAHRRAMMVSRNFSGSAEKAEDKQDSVSPASELEAKLKAKEGEVLDVTVRLSCWPTKCSSRKGANADFAITRFAGDLLETVDVLSLALKSVPPSVLTSSEEANSRDSAQSSLVDNKSPSTHLQELHHGVEMTQRLLLQTLFKYQVKPFDPTGDKFDPNKHEALYQAPVPGKEPGTVIDCQKVGYTIKDRILRAAQVGVAQETT